MNIKRNVRCLKCGKEFVLNLETDLPIKEMIVLGKCSECGSTIQVNFTHFGKEENNTDNLDEKNTDEGNVETPNIFNSGITDVIDIEEDSGSDNTSNKNEKDIGIVDIEEQFPSDTSDALSEIMDDDEE